MEHLIMFLLGTNTVAAATIGGFFLTFWRRTHDRLFLAFALAFWLIAAHWGTIAVFGRGEGAVLVYLLRFLAFGLLIAGIADKNRSGPVRQGTGTVESERPRSE